MTSDETAIRQLMRDWLEASQQGDLNKVLGLMAEDAIFLTPGQAPIQGHDAFAVGFRAGLEQYRLEATSEIQEIQVMGAWAYCWSQLKVRVVPKTGSPLVRSGPVLSIFKKTTENNWVIFRDANMLSPETTTN